MCNHVNCNTQIWSMKWHIARNSKATTIIMKGQLNSLGNSKVRKQAINEHKNMVRSNSTD
jgi:hypothetical protein